MKNPIYARMFDYDRNLLPNEYLRSLEIEVEHIEEAIKRTGYSIGYPGWNLLYYSVLCSLRDDNFNNIVETGTNRGCSTIILAQALKDSKRQGRVFSVEIDCDNYKMAMDNINKAHVQEFVRLFHNDSFSFLSNLSLENELISFAFLDGNHDENLVIKEFEMIYPFLDYKSFVAFDNTYPISDDKENMRVNGALKRIKEKYGGNLINYENVSWYTPGFAIWQKDPFLRDWDSY